MNWFIVLILFLLGCGNKQQQFLDKVNSQVYSPAAQGEEAIIMNSEDATVHTGDPEDLETEEEEVEAEVPIVISGSFLTCQVSGENKKILHCPYPEGLDLGVRPDDILVSKGSRLMGIILEIDQSQHTFSIVFSEEINPSLIANSGSVIQLDLDQGEPEEEEEMEEQEKLSKPVAEVSELEDTAPELPGQAQEGPLAMEFSNLPFTPELAYMDYPVFDVDTGSGFVNEFDLITFLTGGTASLACFENGTRNLIYSSSEMTLKRETGLFSLNLASIDFIEGLDTASFDDINNTYCEVTIKFPSNIQDIGVYIERIVPEEYAFRGTVLLDDLGINAGIIEPKSFATNISCFKPCDPAFEDCECD